MKFRSFNFRLMVINELIELGLLDDQLAPIYEKQRSGYYEKYYEALAGRRSDKNSNDDDVDDFFTEVSAYYKPHPEMKNEIRALKLTPEMLSRVEKLWIDTREIQHMLAPHWLSQNEIFHVNDLHDLTLLPNLKHIVIRHPLSWHLKDLSPLLDVPKLESVRIAIGLGWIPYFRNDPKTWELLKGKGVEVTRDK